MLLEIIKSTFTEPYQNLALEEYLLTNIRPDTIILYLWQNDNTVVIGQNQNAYLQCNMEYINQNNVRIARRLSGGGSVFHDKGNLNYTIIAFKKDFEKETYFSLLISALAKFGIKVEQSGRNDLTVNGIKISGTAFYSNENACYQHGCILVNTDLERMFLCLKVKKDKLIGKDIDSVRSRVCNLREINRDITIATLSETIENEFLNKYIKHVIVSNILIIKSECYQKLLTKYSSWEWNMGKTLDSKMALYKRFSWGDCSLVFDVRGGTIHNAGIYTDSLETNIFHEIEKILKNVKFSKQEILNVLDSFPCHSDIVEDIRKLVQDETQLLET